MADDLQHLRDTDMKLTDQTGQHSALIRELFRRGEGLEAEFRAHLKASTQREASDAAEIASLKLEVAGLKVALDKERSERQADKNQAKAQAAVTSGGVGSLVALVQIVLHHLSK